MKAGSSITLGMNFPEGNGKEMGGALIPKARNHWKVSPGDRSQNQTSTTSGHVCVSPRLERGTSAEFGLIESSWRRNTLARSKLLITKATKRLLLFASSLVLMPAYEMGGRESSKECNDVFAQQNHPCCINQTKLNA